MNDSNSHTQLPDTDAAPFCTHPKTVGVSEEGCRQQTGNVSEICFIQMLNGSNNAEILSFDLIKTKTEQGSALNNTACPLLAKIKRCGYKWTNTMIDDQYR